MVVEGVGDKNPLEYCNIYHHHSMTFVWESYDLVAAFSAERLYDVDTSHMVSRTTECPQQSHTLFPR